jgi:hypothetical protein
MAEIRVGENRAAKRILGGRDRAADGCTTTRRRTVS